MRYLLFFVFFGILFTPECLGGNEGIVSGNGLSVSAGGSDDYFPSGEDDSVRQELDFILYLISRDDYAESLFLLERMPQPDDHWVDSVNYLTGWVLYRQKKLEASAGSLLKVRPGSPVFYKSHFFGAYNLAHTGSHLEAQSVLQAMSVRQGTLPEAMRRFQLSGVSLLERNYDDFLDYSGEFRGDYHVMAQEESRMMHYYVELRQTSPKSPFLAGILSAAVPGLGRVYAGKPAEGIVSFLYLAAFGFTSYDFYRGGGISSPLFILSAGITSVFYAGNIMGSIVAARRVNNEFRYEMDQRILFDLHIPLRNAFN
jgi:TM2 domain-containing membrane protein YozV